MTDQSPSRPVPIGEERARRLKGQYPDYLDDPDGLDSFRHAVERNNGHDMAATVNYNSLGRLIDTIERLRFERDRALATLPAQPSAVPGEPVAWLCEHNDYDNEIEPASVAEPWRAPITSADSEAGWRATPLFAAVPNTPPSDAAGEVARAAKMLLWQYHAAPGAIAYANEMWRALETALATPSPSPVAAGEVEWAATALDRFLTDHEGNGDTDDDRAVDADARKGLNVLRRAALATPPAPNDDLRAVILRDLATERRRYRENSDTWRAYGFCIAVVESAALANRKDHQASGGENRHG